MAILRNSAPLIFQPDAAPAPLDSGPMRLRPVDGDAIPDHLQRMFLFAYLARSGPGAVALDLMGSFGDGLWAIFRTIALPDDEPYALTLWPVGDLPPYLRAVVRTRVPPGGSSAPAAAVIVRVASDAPFTLGPANVQITVVRRITPFEDEQAVTSDKVLRPGGEPATGGCEALPVEKAPIEPCEPHPVEEPDCEVPAPPEPPSKSAGCEVPTEPEFPNKSTGCEVPAEPAPAPEPPNCEVPTEPKLPIQAPGCETPTEPEPAPEMPGCEPPSKPKTPIECEPPAEPSAPKDKAPQPDPLPSEPAPCTPCQPTPPARQRKPRKVGAS